MTETQMKVSELTTPHEAAWLLGYSTRQIYRFIKTNRLKSLALWGKSFILKSELDRFKAEITHWG